MATSLVASNGPVGVSALADANAHASAAAAQAMALEPMGKRFRARTKDLNTAVQSLTILFQDAIAGQIQVSNVSRRCSRAECQQ
jgi:hypothetical protein